MEEQDAKESLAQRQALEKLGISQEFNYADHSEIYNYAYHAVDAPSETVDASIAPPEITIELYASSIPPSDSDNGSQQPSAAREPKAGRENFFRDYAGQVTDAGKLCQVIY